MSNRIVSFLPSATEILYELGVGDQVLAVTHECNYPKEASSKPRVIKSSFDPEKMTSHEIDNKVVELVHTQKDIYILDEQVLKKANPDLIVAQGICEVCSPYTREINRAVEILDGKPQVLILDPKNLDDILQNVIEVGNKVNKIREAQDLVAKLRERIFDIKRIILEYEKLSENWKWNSLGAVKQGQVYAVNANEYFSKPGPRTVTGLEILAKIIHPDTFKDLPIPRNSVQRIDLE